MDRRRQRDGKAEHKKKPDGDYDARLVRGNRPDNGGVAIADGGLSGEKDLEHCRDAGKTERQEQAEEDDAGEELHGRRIRQVAIVVEKAAGHREDNHRRQQRAGNERMRLQTEHGIGPSSRKSPRLPE
jgi:hypothetical protein